MISPPLTFLHPEAFADFLESIPSASGQAAETVKGYAVTVSYKEENEAERLLRSQAIREVIAAAKGRDRKQDKK